MKTKAPYDGAHGSVAERFNAPVLKTDEGLYPSVSSNLTASAKFEKPSVVTEGFFLSRVFPHKLIHITNKNLEL